MRVFAESEPGREKVWVEAEMIGGGRNAILSLVDIRARRKAVQAFGDHNVTVPVTQLAQMGFPARFLRDLEDGRPVRFKMFQQAFEGMIGGGGRFNGLDGYPRAETLSDEDLLREADELEQTAAEISSSSYAESTAKWFDAGFFPVGSRQDALNEGPNKARKLRADAAELRAIVERRRGGVLLHGLEGVPTVPEPGDRIEIVALGPAGSGKVRVVGIVDSAINNSMSGGTDWYIQYTIQPSGRPGYWKQRLDGGTFRVLQKG